MRTPHLNDALLVALKQYQELTGKPFPVIPSLDLHDDSGFWALAELDRDRFVIRVGGGVVPALTSLWTKAFGDDDFLTGVSFPFDADKADAIHVSLVWLIFHEMQHFELGHFCFMGCSFLSETEHGKRFALLSRSVTKPSPIDGLGEVTKAMVPLCLELQADHEAAELVLDAYSADEWPSLRARVAAIAAMMMLIEREDSKLATPHTSHPKAATRIFQLLGHVVEMPIILAHRKAIIRGMDVGAPIELPSQDEQNAFNREVSIPAFFDALNLARISGADSIKHDLGEAEIFFQDVKIAKLEDVSGYTKLQTVGANQWAELAELNSNVLSKLEFRNRQELSS